MTKYCKICKCSALALKVAQKIEFDDKTNICKKCIENEQNQSKNTLFKDQTWKDL